MMYFILKSALSGIIIALVSEIAKRSASFGALVASLPLISILAIIWLWRDTGDKESIAAHAQATFWYVIPSLPFFIVLPMLLRSGWNFWPALCIGCILTIALYAITIMTATRFGVRF